ncbi:MAG: amino acid transporter, partial [Ignavibacteria bacterium]|nr:amino acid transporter [Ignavibacteria bacterium]
NVFITFFLSQLGMVNHWWNVRREEKTWIHKISINGIGLALTTIILVSVVALKFFEGGWVTLVVTGSVIGFALLVKKHYNSAHQLIQKLDSDVIPAITSSLYLLNEEELNKKTISREAKPEDKTAVVLVNGFNGLGAHTLLSVIKTFPGIFKNYVFLQAGVVDAGGFKGSAEVTNLEEFVHKETNQYVDFMKRSGYAADSFTSVGTDVVDQITELSDQVFKKYPNSVFFGGQLVFPNETFFTRLLHNQIVFSVQRRLYHEGYPFVILPIRVSY